MTITASEPVAASVPAIPRGPGAAVRRTAWHASGIVASFRTHGASLAAQVPGMLRGTRSAARHTTSTLQMLPDPTLRWLIAGSAGLAAGLFAAGAPRVVTTLGAVPAVVMAAAIALRAGATEG